MDDISTIVLPVLALVGGHRFAREWQGSRFEEAFENDQSVYMRAVFYGAILFVTVATIWLFFRFLVELLPALREWQLPSLLFGIAYAELRWWELATCSFVTMLIGRPLALALNKCPHLAAFYRAEYARHIATNELADLLQRAMTTKIPIQVTLRTGKVYVGKVNSGISNFEKEQYFTLCPMISGYRTETHQVEYNTNYQPALDLAKKASDNGDPSLAEALNKIIPVAEIVSCNLFNIEADTSILKEYKRPPAVDSSVPPTP